MFFPGHCLPSRIDAPRNAVGGYDRERSGRFREASCLINRLSMPSKSMNFTDVPPAWRLPDGVDAPLWEYAHSARLAAEEDVYFADHPLFRADQRALDER